MWWEKVLRFMQGRYGRTSCTGSCWLEERFSSFYQTLFLRRFFLLLGWILVVLAFVRAFSKDYSRRYAENQKFLELTGKIRKVFGKQKYVMEQRKDYHIYTCPQCKQKIRMPRGKGKVEISCPKCHTKFIKKLEYVWKLLEWILKRALVWDLPPAENGGRREGM